MTAKKNVVNILSADVSTPSNTGLTIEHIFKFADDLERCLRHGMPKDTPLKVSSQGGSISRITVEHRTSVAEDLTTEARCYDSDEVNVEKSYVEKSYVEKFRVASAAAKVARP